MNKITVPNTKPRNHVVLASRGKRGGAHTSGARRDRRDQRKLQD